MRKNLCMRNAAGGEGARGLTLLELLIGIAITVTLVALVARSVSRVTVRARVVGTRAIIETFATAQAMVQSSTGRYTTTLAELREAGVPEGFGSSWDGPYLRTASTIDPWGNPYFYSSWLGGEAGTDHGGHNLWYYARGGTVIMDSGTLPRQTGAPVDIEYTFSAREDDTHIIRVINNGISSGWVTANGTRTVSPNQFRHTVTEFTAEVVLEEDNTLTVRFASTPGAYARVLVETTGPPELPPEELSGEGLGWYDVFGGSPALGYLLGSYGADGQAGGTGLNADIIYGLKQQ